MAKHFDLADAPLFDPRYNIAPTQPAPVIRLDVKTGRRAFDWLRWGLVPSWAKDLAIGNQLINARCETLSSKPAFRHAFRQRRCLIVADGFYEWQRQGKRKQPFYITAADGAPLALAGLWERWAPRSMPASGSAADTGAFESCTIVTTDANECLRSLHNRMPVVLPRAAWQTWLDPKVDDAAALQALLVPCPDDRLISYAVDSAVNSPSNDSPQCIEPLVAAPPKPAEGMLF